MSLVPGARSEPASLLASACGYQVPANGALVKSRTSVLAPAEPSVALTAEQLSGSIEASTVTATALLRRAPHRSAAYWKAIRRCAPRVVPALPPTGLTGVASLNPSP